MSDKSKIEWTGATWNPTHGCTKIGPGCTHCYAEVMAHRLKCMGKPGYERGFALALAPNKLLEPFKWTKAKRVFVNSMSDLFHKDVPDDYIVDVARVMASANWHTYQVLTKRSERMRDLLNSKLGFVALMPHIWWGVSVEDKKFGLPRIAHLQDANVKTRFLSVEPLLEDIGSVDIKGIKWVIVGGESGPGARPMEAAWVESIYRQCIGKRIPFFFKQWGGVQKKKAGRILHGTTYDEYPPPIAMPAISLVARKAGQLKMYELLKHLNAADQYSVMSQKERMKVISSDPLNGFDPV